MGRNTGKMDYYLDEFFPENDVRYLTYSGEYDSDNTEGNGRTKVPLADWKAERLQLLAKKSALNVEYQKLKSDVNQVSRIRSNAYSILGVERRETQQSQGEIAVGVRNISATASKSTPKLTENTPMPMKERLAWAKSKADEYNAGQAQTPKSKAEKNYDRGR